VPLSSTPTMYIVDPTDPNRVITTEDDDYCAASLRVLYYEANPDVSGNGVSTQLKSIEPGYPI